MSSNKGASSQERILTALREARTKLDAVERERTDPIAVIGTGCRFPGGADTPDRYWDLLRSGVDAMGTVPADRWDAERYFDPDPDAAGKMYTLAGGFLDSVDRFEPEFFRISRREAVSLDPQQRLLLEVSWEALEHAGQAPDTLRGSRTGVFMGLSWHDYERAVFGIDPKRLDAYAGLGNTPSIAVGRIAFFLGVNGPTAQIDTACSSSLTSVHLACQSLRTGECTMALAGGVSLMISPLSTVFCCSIKALSPTGRCHTFDAAADGYARGEGCGVVVLKRLRDAVASGDSILALIRGSAINHDGPASGLTVPNRHAQRDVIQQALASGRVDPLDVEYVEAHGTGTSLGDPIEIGALCDALGDNRSADHPLRVGSVKTNFGHLEAAAGIAGLIKVVLSLKHRAIPPHLGLKQPSPNIDWNQFPVTVPTELVPWNSERPIAGVSSFGISGTNAHVVLEGVREPETPRSAKAEPHLLTLSARSGEALRTMAGDYSAYMESEPSVSTLEDLCYTSHVGRTHFRHRLALMGETREQLVESLRGYAQGGGVRGGSLGRVGAEPPKVAFLCTGQGAQYVGMGRELFDSEPTFRTVLERSDAVLRAKLDRSLIDVIYAQAEDASPLLGQTAYAQPALFAIEYALATLWRSWGVEPSIVMGHSIGEYVAACLAGVFSLEDGLTLVTERGRLMQALPRGAMVAVYADEARVAEAVAPHAQGVAIASINGPRNVVVSGTRELVAAVVDSLRETGVDSRPLDVSHAFHSPSMEPMLDEFERLASRVSYAAPRLRLLSNITGSVDAANGTTANHWRRHVREPVRFAAGIAALEREGCQVFVEIGPQPTLLGMGKQCLNDDDDRAWLPSVRRGRSERSQLLHSLSELYVRGVPVDWSGVHRHHRRQRVAMPTYPFQRERYWVEDDASLEETVPAGLSQTEPQHPLLGRRKHSAGLPEGTVEFETKLGPDAPSYLADHRVFDQLIPPATTYVEMALAGGARVLGAERLKLEDVVVQQPLVLQEDVSKIVQCVISRDGHSHRFRVFGLSVDVHNREDDWTLHASGSMSLAQPEEGLAAADSGLAMTEGTPSEAISVETCYARFREQGLALGPRFKAIQALWRRGDVAFGRIGLPSPLNAGTAASDYLLHPVLLDGCGKAIAAAFPPGDDEDTYLPVGIERLVLLRRPGSQVWFEAELRGTTGDRALRQADLRLFDKTGALVARVEGVTTRRVKKSLALRSLYPNRDDWYSQVAWEQSSPVGPAVPTTGTWLIFADEAGVGRRLNPLLTVSGGTTIMVSPASEYQKRDSSSYTVNPSDPTHFERLFSECGADTSPIQGIVYLWSVSATSPEDPSLSELLETQHRDCAALLHLTQAAVRASLPEGPRLWLVTRGAQCAGTPGTTTDVAHAPIWGLGRVIGLEHAELRPISVDLDPQTIGRDDEAEMLRQEVLAKDGETQVAYRNGTRHVARLVRCGIPQANRRGATIDAAGTYLITGGLGGLGLRVAEWLIAAGSRNLLLAGRRPPGDSAADAIRALERSGARLKSVQVDISQPEEVKRLLATIPSDFPLPRCRACRRSAGRWKPPATRCGPLRDCPAAEGRRGLESSSAHQGRSARLLCRFFVDGLDPRIHGSGQLLRSQCFPRPAGPSPPGAGSCRPECELGSVGRDWNDR